MLADSTHAAERHEEDTANAKGGVLLMQVIGFMDAGHTAARGRVSTGEGEM